MHEGSISLKILLETKLKSESFEPLIDILRFLVQKLWLKQLNLDKNKNIDYFCFGYFTQLFFFIAD